MKVLHILGSLSMGGAERWLLEVLRHWREQGVNRPQFDFIATSGCPGIFDAEIGALGSEIFYVPFTRSTLMPFAVEFRRILRAGNYAAIHDHQGWVCGWHFLLGVGLLPPVRIAHAHNAAFELRVLGSVRRSLAHIGIRLISTYATHIVASSRTVLAEYGFTSSMFPGITKFPLYCGIDPDRFRGDPNMAKAQLCGEFGWPDNSVIILVAGRLDAFIDENHLLIWKNTRKAIAIGIECAKRDPRIRVLFAGSLNPAVLTFRQLVEDAGLSDRIIFAGLRLDIASLMLGSDVLLFPSREEGLGMVAVEAQAAGLPVLASDAVPVDCAVVPGMVRFLSAGAAVGIWADNIFELMARPRDVITGNKSVAKSHFSIIQSANTLVNVYSGSKNL